MGDNQQNGWVTGGEVRVRGWLMGSGGVWVSPWEPVEWRAGMCTAAQGSSCSRSEISNLCCVHMLVICEFLKAEIRCQETEVGSFPRALLTLLDSRLHQLCLAFAYFGYVLCLKTFSL